MKPLAGVCVVLSLIALGACAPGARLSDPGIFPAERAAYSVPFALAWSLHHGERVPVDHVAAHHAYMAAARAGDVRAMNNLGVLRMSGWGLSRDAGQAVAHFRQAASFDDSAARYNLGLAYAHGWGVPADMASAARLMAQSASQGHPKALHWLARDAMARGDVAAAGILYARAAEAGSEEAARVVAAGASAPEARALVQRRALPSAIAADVFGSSTCVGCTRFERAALLQEVADAKQRAASGDPVASYNLGVRYEAGAGVPRDPFEAARRHLAAAQAGYAPAQYAVGRLYAVGEGLAMDLVSAHAWLNLASASGGDVGMQAAMAREALAPYLTPSEVVAAYSLATAWRPARPLGTRL
jgi:TPR repeat protein